MRQYMSLIYIKQFYASFFYFSFINPKVKKLYILYDMKYWNNDVFPNLFDNNIYK